MKYRSNSILAFIPQNKEGELILNQTLYFQQSLGMRLFILDILKPTSIFTHLFQTKKRNSQISEAKEKLHRFVENIIQKEIPRNLILRIKAGDVLSTLIKESKKGGYEFIVADKSEGNFKGVLSRNEIDKFISRSHCPVLTISKDFSAGKISKIIIPIDISQTTKKHLYWATFFAKEFNAQIQIVSALNINIDETKSLAFRNAEKIKKMLIERGIKCEVKILKVHSQKKHKIIIDS